jgi:large subunit ribosomal protein L3
MATLSKARAGSLQYWPRKRARRVLPRVNWNHIENISSDKGFLGFITYKVGMKSAILKDETPNSMTKQKNIAHPVTILECPPCKIFSVRFYKNNNLIKEILNDNLEKHLKRKVKIPKSKPEKKIDSILEEEIKKKDFDNLRVIVYTIVNKTNIKKTPDMVEIGLGGGLEDKINFIKENINKEILLNDSFNINELIDIRGLTKARGIQGPVRRFGITLRNHKSEKGIRKPGSIGPWHPAHLTFRIPFAGQLGYFHRNIYNLMIVDSENIDKKNINPNEGFKNYGKIKTNYLIVLGSVSGNQKTPLIIAKPIRKTKDQLKTKYNLLKIR